MDLVIPSFSWKERGEVPSDSPGKVNVLFERWKRKGGAGNLEKDASQRRA